LLRSAANCRLLAALMLKKNSGLRTIVLIWMSAFYQVRKYLPSAGNVWLQRHNSGQWPFLMVKAVDLRLCNDPTVIASEHLWLT
jgi:hypothetical protein